MNYCIFILTLGRYYEGQLHVQINKTIKEKSEKIAEKEGRTLSEVIREFFASYVRKGEKNAKSL
jgi:hypothetical protein